MIRLAKPEEYPDRVGEVRFVAEEDGKAVGFICVSRIPSREGEQCWIHDLECEGDEMAAASLMLRARSQANTWGFQDVWANVSNRRLAKALLAHGWEEKQVILKGKTSNGN